MKNQNRWLWWVLGFVILVGAFLRLYDLGEKSLWMDELGTWRFSQGPSLADWYQRYSQSSEPFPATYYFFRFLWLRLFGDEAWVLRLPEALAGIACVPAIFFLGRRIADERLGLLAAGILAVASSPILHSQDARPYAFLLLFSILLADSTLGLADRASSRRDQILFVISAVALSQLHYLGVYLCVLSGTFLLVDSLLSKKSIPRALWIGAGVALFLFLPWLPRMLFQFGHSPANDNIRTRSIFKMLTSFFKFSFFSDDQPAHPATFALYWFFVASILFSLFEDVRRRSLIFLWGWMALPFLTIWLKSIVSQPMYRARYLIISLPAVVLLGALPFTRRTHKHPLAFYVGALVIVLTMLGHSLLEYGIYGPNARRVLKDGIGHIETEATSTDLEFWTCCPDPVALSYYIDRSPTLKNVWIGKKQCVAIEPGSFNRKKLAVLFHHRPSGEFVTQMLALGWQLEKAEKENDYDSFLFRAR